MKQSTKAKGHKGSDLPGKNFTPKAKTMSPVAKLMATFYSIELK